MRKTYVFLLLLLILSSFIFPYKKIKLLNGFTLYYFPQNDEIFKISIIFKNGYLLDEKYGEGITHLSLEIFRESLESSLKKLGERGDVKFVSKENYIYIFFPFSRKNLNNTFFLLSSYFLNFSVDKKLFSKTKEKISLDVLNSCENIFLKFDRSARKNLFLCNYCGFTENYSNFKKITKSEVEKFLEDFFSPQNITICFMGKIGNKSIYLFTSKYFGKLIKGDDLNLKIQEKYNREKEITLNCGVDKKNIKLLYFEIPYDFNEESILSDIFEKFLIDRLKEKVKVLKVKNISMGEKGIVEIFVKCKDIKKIEDFISSLSMDSKSLSHYKKELKQQIEEKTGGEFEMVEFSLKNKISPFLIKEMINYLNSIEIDDLKFIEEKYFSPKNLYLIECNR